MEKLDRFVPKVYGISAGEDDVGIIGSMHEGTPTIANTIAEIQSLAAYENGLRSILIGENSPILEEDNGLFKLITYFLAYMSQTGVAEWSATEEYHENSMVNYGGTLFYSIENANINNEPIDDAFWRRANDDSTLAYEAAIQTRLFTSASANWTYDQAVQEVGTNGRPILKQPGNALAAFYIDASLFSNVGLATPKMRIDFDVVNYTGAAGSIASIGLFPVTTFPAYNSPTAGWVMGAVVPGSNNGGIVLDANGRQHSKTGLFNVPASGWYMLAQDNGPLGGAPQTVIINARLLACNVLPA